MRLVAETFADEIYSDSDWVSSISNLTRFNRRRGDGCTGAFYLPNMHIGTDWVCTVMTIHLQILFWVSILHVVIASLNVFAIVPTLLARCSRKIAGGKSVSNESSSSDDDEFDHRIDNNDYYDTRGMYGVHHRQSPYVLLIQLFQLFYNLLNVSVGAAGLVAIKVDSVEWLRASTLLSLLFLLFVLILFIWQECCIEDYSAADEDRLCGMLCNLFLACIRLLIHILGLVFAWNYAWWETPLMIVSKARRDRYHEDYILDYNSSSYSFDFYGPESLDYDF